MEHARGHAHARASPPDTCGACGNAAAAQSPRAGRARLQRRVLGSRGRPARGLALGAGCPEVNLGNQRGRKRAGAGRFKALASPRRLPVCWLRGKVTTRLFLLGWNFSNGLCAGELPPLPSPQRRTGGFQDRGGGRLYPPSHARTPTPGSVAVAGTREEGRRVVTPASAGARPSAPAISAGRSAGTRTPSPAAPSAAKGDPFPSPAASLRRRGATRLGAGLPKGWGAQEGSGRQPYLSP